MQYINHVTIEMAISHSVWLLCVFILANCASISVVHFLFLPFQMTGHRCSETPQSLVWAWFPSYMTCFSCFNTTFCTARPRRTSPRTRRRGRMSRARWNQEGITRSCIVFSHCRPLFAASVSLWSTWGEATMREHVYSQNNMLVYTYSILYHLQTIFYVLLYCFDHCIFMYIVYSVKHVLCTAAVAAAIH